MALLATDTLGLALVTQFMGMAQVAEEEEVGAGSEEADGRTFPLFFIVGNTLEHLRLIE
jgi:hypothetical protein